MSASHVESVARTLFNQGSVAGAEEVLQYYLVDHSGHYAQRCLLGREDSPWYPSMRIFRQRSVRQWDAPLDAAYQALEQTLAGHDQ